MQEDLTFALRLNNAELNAGMAASRARAVDLGGGIDRLSSGLDRFSGKSVKDASQAVGALTGVFGRQAGASAEVLRGLDDLAGVLGSGGLLGIGLAAAGIGFAALSKHMDEVQKRADKMIATSLAGFADLAGRRSALEDEVAKLNAQLGLDKKSPEQIIAAFEAEATRIRAEQQRRRDEIKGLGTAGATSERRADLALEIKQLEGILTLESQRADRLVRLANAETEAAQKSKKAIDEKAESYRGLTTAARELAGVMAGIPGMGAGAALNAMIPDDERGFAPTGAAAPFSPGGVLGIARDVQQQKLAMLGEFADEEVNLERYKLARIEEMWRDSALMLKEIQGQTTDDLGQISQRAFSESVSATSGFFTTLIEAEGAHQRAILEENTVAAAVAEETKRQAFAISAAQALAGIGSELVGLGTKQVFEGTGIAIASHGLDPAGYALAGLGAAAIAAGVGMGAASAGIGQGAQTAIAGVGARAQAQEDAREERERELERAKRERGLGGGSKGAGTSGTGGGVTIVNNYGLGVPKEKVAKDMRDLWEWMDSSGWSPRSRPR